MCIGKRLRSWTLAALLAGGLAPVGPVVAEPNEVVDANDDGESDLANILGAIDHLKSVGVVFDDNDGQGHIPVRRRDGKYHMACVDLLLVAYRAAGYGLGTRQVAAVLQHVRRNPKFHYYPGPGVNPRVEKWLPEQPFRVGDMVFISYDDNNDRHSGIVTGVDPTTGLPSYITQVSIYNDNEGLHRSTFNAFFSLKCRQLIGWARPAAWDDAPMPAEEIALTVTPAQPVRPANSGITTVGVREKLHQ